MGKNNKVNFLDKKKDIKNHEIANALGIIIKDERGNDLPDEMIINSLIKTRDMVSRCINDLSKNKQFTNDGQFFVNDEAKKAFLFNVRFIPGIGQATFFKIAKLVNESK